MVDLIRRVIWAPREGPQKALVDCLFREIFFGGARGGGWTDGVLGKYAIKAALYGSAFNALFCRRELPMLDDGIECSKEIYGKRSSTMKRRSMTSLPRLRSSSLDDEGPTFPDQGLLRDSRPSRRCPRFSACNKSPVAGLNQSKRARVGNARLISTECCVVLGRRPKI